MKKILFISFLIISILPKTMAQESEELDSVVIAPKNNLYRFAIGMSYGTGNLVLRDKVISTFRYKGNYQPFGLHFEVRNQYSKSSYSLEFMNSPTLKTETNKGFEYKGDLGEFYPSSTDGLDFSTLKTKNSSFNITQLYMLKKTESKDVQVYFGYDLSSRFFTKKFIQFEYVNELRERIMSAGFVANFELHINDKHHLEYNLSVPILSYASRSLSNANADPVTVSSSKVTILGKVAGFDSRFSYRFQAHPRFSLKASYSFHYMQVTFPRKEQWGNNQLTVGAFFHF